MRSRFSGTLSYDGTLRWTTSHPRDGKLIERSNRHQSGHNGFGRALGLFAVSETADIFGGLACDTEIAESPWRLGSAQASLHHVLIRGVAGVAADARTETACAWRADRSAAVDTGACLVANKDIVARPRRQDGT